MRKLFDAMHFFKLMVGFLNYREDTFFSAIIFVFYFHFDGGLLNELVTANFVLLLLHPAVSCNVGHSKAVHYLNAVLIVNNDDKCNPFIRSCLKNNFLKFIIQLMIVKQIGKWKKVQGESMIWITIRRNNLFIEKTTNPRLPNLHCGTS